MNLKSFTLPLAAFVASCGLFASDTSSPIRRAILNRVAEWATSGSMDSGFRVSSICGISPSPSENKSAPNVSQASPQGVSGSLSAADSNRSSLSTTVTALSGVTATGPSTISIIESARGFPLSATSAKGVAPVVSLASSPIAQVAAAGGNGFDRGGGDWVAIEFLAYGSAFLRDLKRLHAQNLFSGISESEIEKAINSFRINPSLQPIFDRLGVQRDAVTDLTRMTIEVYQPSWMVATEGKKFRASLVVHEYLRASGLSREDDLYGWSQKIIEKLSEDPEAFIFRVQSNQVDQARFQNIIDQSVINNLDRFECRPIRGVFSNTLKVTIRSSGALGIQVSVFYPETGTWKIYSDYNQNLSQFSFNGTLTSMLFADHAALHLEVPSVIARGGSIYGHIRYGEYGSGKAADILCQPITPMEMIHTKSE